MKLYKCDGDFDLMLSEGSLEGIPAVVFGYLLALEKMTGGDVFIWKRVSREWDEPGWVHITTATRIYK